MKNAFEVKNPDFNLSPMTGMTRRHYIDCTKYILERAFKHVKSFDRPIVFPTISRARLLRTSRVCDPKLQLSGQPVHHVPSVHRARAAGKFAVLDREGK
jgi:hypothetical protein